MAELGVDAPRFHDEVGAYARELGVGVVVGVGELSRRYGPDEWAPDCGPRPSSSCAASSSPVTRCSSRHRAAVGLEVVADALAGVAAQ